MSEIYFANKLKDKPEWVYDDLTIQGELVSVGNAEGSFDEYDDSDPAQLESILAVQALAMGSLIHAARVRIRGDEYNRRHGFSILSESSFSQDPYDGATEDYLTYRIQKSDYYDWSMRVRFRSNERTEEKKRISELEDFYFAWCRDNRIIAATLNKHTVETDGYTTIDRLNTARPVSNTEVLDLRSRMLDHVEKSGAWPEGSFMRPPKKYLEKINRD